MGNDTQAPILLGVGGALLFISLCLLCARLWSRVRSASRLHVDDWTVLGGTILALGQYALLAAAVVYGLGRHARFVSFQRRRTSLELIFISQVFWYWSITLVKLSVACLLLRVKRTHRWKVFLYAIMTLLVLAAIVQTCFQFLQCRPFAVYWDPRVFRVVQVQCFRRSVINANIVLFSSFQVALDVVFSFVPITFIRKLNRPRREKIFMCVLMGLGLFASCAAIIRTMTLQGFYTSRDIFRTNVYIALWAVVEQQFALIAATIPTLKSFMEASLTKLGLFFYNEGDEAKARGRLVAFGLLGEGDQLDRADRKTAAAAAGTETVVSVGSGAKSVRKMKDEFDDSVFEIEIESESESEKDIEDMLAQMARSPV
ncbi:hypothetical protein BDV95DRAFT_506428 [Massariosphaeria phaeospora]|uniref:Rhodopsin domain-containing protein n=1 Tax=Massariosphaeria phaeospora TaxID=100035 RepID=A0A7C8HZ16_9PLEO|nr:hypothetical protein BDV95DRAFT_506428 [Massariosphaeria phaeospora]